MVRTLLSDLHKDPERSLREKTISELCDHFAIDLEHSQKVAANAIAILNQLQQIQPMPVHLAPVLESAALLHDIGTNVKVDRHHIYGRNLILKHKLGGFNDLQRSMLAFLISLHRKSVKHKKLEKQLRKSHIPPDSEQQALRLAAILRIADGLDQSHTQTTCIEDIREEDHRYVLEISGPHGKRDGGRALQKSDLWTYTFQRPLHCILSKKQILLPGPQWEGLALPAESLTRIELEPNDKILDAGRKILTFHFIRMLQHEPGTRLGNDIESVHDMRVAIRRMRTATKILKPFFPKKLISPLRKGLKSTTKSLGDVRDLDVFKLNFDRYIDEQSSWRSTAFEPLYQRWNDQHELARKTMLEFLDSKSYRSYVGDFATLIGSFDKQIRKYSQDSRDIQISQVLPGLIYEQDKSLRLFDQRVENAPVNVLHTLRIEIKRFRYTLEYFEAVLEPDAQQVIEAAIKLQDHLGDLHDAAFALNFVRSQINKKQRDQIHNRANTQYAQQLEKQIEQLSKTFSDAWWQFRSSENSQRLASAIALL